VLDQFKTGILVDLVVARARVDKTVPDSNNLRKGWRTDELLIGDIDLLIVYGRNDPTGYAKIGRKVLEEVEDLPEMKVLAMLAILRGERLLSLIPEQERTICQLSEVLKAAISVLPNGTRKKRCRELFLYNMGVFYDASGRFDLAVVTQEWAAREAGEGSSSAEISLFLSVVYCLKSALVAGKSSDELEIIFSNLEEKFKQLTEALRGSELEVQWVEGNCPIHMIKACVWLDQSHPKWNNWVETAIAAAGKLGKAWEPAVEFVLAADMDKKNNLGAAKALEAVVANEQSSNEVKATALLILARRAWQAGGAGGINEAKTFVGRMPIEGAQHVRSIVRGRIII